jgi:beta-lactamase regulating signal transducer with metallopeptidase domain
MKFRKSLLAAVAAASIVSTPVMAQTLSPSASASGAANVKRVNAEAKGERRRGSGAVIGVVLVLGLLGALAGLSSGGNSSGGNPASP